MDQSVSKAINPLQPIIVAIRGYLDAADLHSRDSIEADIQAQRARADASLRWAAHRDEIIAYCRKRRLDETTWCQKNLGISLRTMQSYVRLARMWQVYESRRRRLGDCGRNGMGLANDLLCGPAGIGTRRGGSASRNGLGIITSQSYNPLADYNGTPLDFFTGLHAACGFTVDACATKRTALLPQFFSPQQDGLKQSWVGHRVYCNPPFHRGSIVKWLEKGLTSGAELVVYLLPAEVNSKWWHRLVLPHATAILYPEGRMKFAGHQQVAKFNVAVVIFGRVPNALAVRTVNRAWCAGLRLNDAG